MAFIAVAQLWLHIDVYLSSKLFTFLCDSATFQSEVEDTLKRIQSHKGVQGLIVVNSEGSAYSM